MEISKITLVMMAGLPGAGKTTLAYALQAVLGWHVIDKDKYRITLLKQGLDEDLAANKAYERSFVEIYHALNNEKASVIFDTAALQSSIVDTVKEIIGSIEDVRLKVVLCVIDRDERDYRLRNRPMQHTRNTVEPETIADYLQYFDHLPQDTFTLFTNIPLEECISKAQAYVTS